MSQLNRNNRLEDSQRLSDLFKEVRIAENVANQNFRALFLEPYPYANGSKQERSRTNKQIPPRRPRRFYIN